MITLGQGTDYLSESLRFIEASYSLKKQRLDILGHMDTSILY